MNISLIPPHNVDTVWPGLAEGMERSCRRSGGGIVAGDVWQACRSGRAFLFIAHDGETIAGASVWYLETVSNGTKFRCMALYGKGMSGWIHEMHQAVKNVAKDSGAVSLVSEGRKGWQAIFPEANAVRIQYEEPI